MSKPTLRKIIDFTWSKKVFFDYLVVGLVSAGIGALYVFVYWLVTGEITE